MPGTFLKKQPKKLLDFFMVLCYITIKQQPITAEEFYG